MQVNKVRRGDYIVTLHGHTFLLSNNGEQNGNWSLFNEAEVEINTIERKSDMLELMRQWSPEKTSKEATTSYNWFSPNY